MEKDFVFKSEKPKLKLDKHLPQIVISKKAREMFMEWWNNDIRFETSIPKVFESGYMIIQYDYIDKQQELIDTHKECIKLVAKHFHTTYRQAEYMIKDLIQCFSTIKVYFKFLSENSIMTEIFGNDDTRIFKMDFGVGESGPEPELITTDIINLILDADTIYSSLYLKDENSAKSLEPITKVILAQLVTTIWYIATTKSTKYIYEKKSPVIVSRTKNVVKVSDTKTINTPIYDLNKIRVVKLEQLQTRKKGWTYSHSFQVHGHYRHYKSGKTVFIQSYTKGKDKEFKQQTIIVDPKE